MARVAVNPCRKALPPTGPISPPQKKPARASVPSASATTRVVVRLGEHVRPAAVAGEEQRPGRPRAAVHAAKRLPEICVRRGGVADKEAQGLADPHRLAER